MALARSKIDAINLDNIEPNPFQPRKVFDGEKIREMADSIKANGLLQKITIIPKMDDKFRPVEDKYYIISGERRFRAYTLLAEEEGLEYRAIEAVIETIENLDPEGYEQKLMVDALLENIDRVDLTPVEKAEAIKNIQDKTGKTYKDIAEIMGKSEGTVKNLMSTYNQLSPEEREIVKKEKLGARKIKEMIDKKRPQKPSEVLKRGGVGHSNPTPEKMNPGASGDVVEDSKSEVLIEENLEGLTSDQKFERLSIYLSELLGTESMDEKLSFVTEFVSDYATKE